MDIGGFLEMFRNINNFHLNFPVAACTERDKIMKMVGPSEVKILSRDIFENPPSIDMMNVWFAVRGKVVSLTNLANEFVSRSSLSPLAFPVWSIGTVRQAIGAINRHRNGPGLM